MNRPLAPGAVTRAGLPHFKKAKIQKEPAESLPAAAHVPAVSVKFGSLLQLNRKDARKKVGLSNGKYIDHVNIFQNRVSAHKSADTIRK